MLIEKMSQPVSAIGKPVTGLPQQILLLVSREVKLWALLNEFLKVLLDKRSSSRSGFRYKSQHCATKSLSSFR